MVLEGEFCYMWNVASEAQDGVDRQEFVVAADSTRGGATQVVLRSYSSRTATIAQCHEVLWSHKQCEKEDRDREDTSLCLLCPFHPRMWMS